MHKRPLPFLTPLLFAAALAALTACGSSVHHGEDSEVAQTPNAQTTASTGEPNNAASPNNGVSTPAVTATTGNTNDANVVGPVVSPNVVAAIATLGGPNNAYTLVGRFDNATPAALRFTLSNSKLGATFTGTSLGITLADSGTDTYAVQIDGNATAVVTTSPGSTPVVYPVATGLADGNHTVWIVRRSEAAQDDQTNTNLATGTATFTGFVLSANGVLGAPPAPRPHLIVALGDSSFTGYGVSQLQTPNNLCVYSIATQNAQLSVPGQLADLLNAELINVSMSGKGLVQSAYDPNNPDQMAAMWQKLLPPSDSPNYTFPTLDVAAALVAAGSDDLIGASGSGTITNPNLYVSTYADVLANMRSHYPKAVLVGIVNPDASDTDRTTLISLIGKAVAQRTTAGDANVFVFDYWANDPNGYTNFATARTALNLGVGCQSHPSIAGSAFLAGRLNTFLRAHASF